MVNIRLVPKLLLLPLYPSATEQENRHFGRDAEIQAMDGNKSVVQMLESGKVIYNNESTKRIVHETHERHEQDML